MRIWQWLASLVGSAPAGRQDIDRVIDQSHAVERELLERQAVLDRELRYWALRTRHDDDAPDHHH